MEEKKNWASTLLNGANDLYEHVCNLKFPVGSIGEGVIDAGFYAYVTL